MKNLVKSARLFAGAALVSAASLPALVMAAVPADVTTELSNVKADALTVAGVVLVAIIAIFAFKFIRKGL